MSDKIELSNAHMVEAVQSYAAGKTTTDIINDLLDEFELEDTPENRSNLQNLLRPANPNDKRFSASKYGVQYDLARDAMVEILREKWRGYIEMIFNSLVAGADEFADIRTSLNSMLDNASDFDITSNTEYLNTVRALTSLQKAETERANAATNLLDVLVNSNPVQSSQSQDE